MEQNGLRLSDFVDSPDLHQRLLGDYRGDYSLGVTSSDEGAEVLLLRVATENLSNFPHEIQYLGHRIQVVVKGSFRKPKPLGRRNVA